MITDAVTQYLAQGGTVTTVPGFTGIKPMPPRVPAPVSTNPLRKDHGEGRTADWYTTVELALELDHASTNSVRALQDDEIKRLYEVADLYSANSPN